MQNNEPQNNISEVFTGENGKKGVKLGSVSTSVSEVSRLQECGA